MDVRHIAAVMLGGIVVAVAALGTATDRDQRSAMAHYGRVPTAYTATTGGGGGYVAPAPGDTFDNPDLTYEARDGRIITTTPVAPAAAADADGVVADNRVGPAIVGEGIVGEGKVGPAIVGDGKVGPKRVGPKIVGAKRVGPKRVGPKLVGGGGGGAAPHHHHHHVRGPVKHYPPGWTITGNDGPGEPVNHRRGFHHHRY